MDIEKHIKCLAALRRLGYFSLIFWPAFLIAGFMAFDAPNSVEHIGPYIALAISIGYGALPFVAPRLAERAWDAGYIKTAYFVGVLPFSIFPILFVFNLLIYALTALTFKS